MVKPMPIELQGGLAVPLAACVEVLVVDVADTVNVHREIVVEDHYLAVRRVGVPLDHSVRRIFYRRRHVEIGVVQEVVRVSGSHSYR
jgi:hypothetical protein